MDSLGFIFLFFLLLVLDISSLVGEEMVGDGRFPCSGVPSHNGVKKKRYCQEYTDTIDVGGQVLHKVQGQLEKLLERQHYFDNMDNVEMYSAEY